MSSPTGEIVILTSSRGGHKIFAIYVGITLKPEKGRAFSGGRILGLALNPRIMTPLLLYVAPAALGVLYLFGTRENLFYAEHFSDDGFYLTWAHFLAQGRGFLDKPFFVNPFYLYFLAVLMKLSITSGLGIRLVQIALASAIYPLTYLLGERLFNRTAGLLAALALLGYGPLLHAMTDLQSSSLETLLIVLLAWLLCGKPGRPRLAAAGLTCGLLALSRPTFLPFVPLAAVAILFRRFAPQIGGPRRDAGGAAVFGLACILVVAPVTIRNLVVGGDLVLVSSHGGINFYIGNSPPAQGWFYVPRGIHGSLMGINLIDSTRVAEESVGHALKPSEVSRFWFREGLHFLRDAPGRAALLYARKLLLLVHSYEVPANTEYALARSGSTLLAALGVPFALLFAAGTAGLVLARDRWRDLLFIILILATQSLGLVLFFVASRYRLPLAPLWAVCAGGTLVALGRARGSAPWRAWAGVAMLLLTVAALSYPYPMIRKIQQFARASQFQGLGIYLYEKRNLVEAEKALRSALAALPTAKLAHRYLAEILEARGEAAAAAEEWRQTIALYGSDSPSGRQATDRLNRLKARAVIP